MTWRIVFSVALIPVSIVVLLLLYDYVPEPPLLLEKSHVATALSAFPSLVAFVVLVVIPSMRSARG